MNTLKDSLDHLLTTNADLETLKPLIRFVIHKSYNETEVVELTKQLQAEITPIFVSSSFSQTLSSEKVSKNKFWIVALGSCLFELAQRGQSNETLFSTFIHDLCLPFFSNPPKSNINASDKEFLNHYLQLLMDQAVTLAAISYAPNFFPTLLKPIPVVVHAEVSKSIMKKNKKKHQPADTNLPEDMWSIQVFTSALQALNDLLSSPIKEIHLNLSEITCSILKFGLEYILSPPSRFHFKDLVIRKLLPLASSPILSTDINSIRDSLWKSIVILHSSIDVEHYRPFVYSILVQLFDRLLPISNQNHLDIRTYDLYWQIIMDSLVNMAEPSMRKRAVYLLKRSIHSSLDSIAVTSKFFSWDPQNKEFENSMWSKYFLLLDAQEDNDLSITKSMWVLFEELLLMCSEDVGTDIELDKTHQQPKSARITLIHAEWLRIFILRMLGSDSKPLRKIALWTIFSKYDKIEGSRQCLLFRSSKFVQGLLLALHDVITVFDKETEKYEQIFARFLLVCLLCHDSSDSKLKFMRDMTSFLMANKIGGQPITAWLAFLSRVSPSNHQLDGLPFDNHHNALMHIPLFNDEYCFYIMNCFQSVLTGMIPDIQHKCITYSLDAVLNWIDVHNATPETIIQLLKNVPELYLSKSTVVPRMASLLNAINRLEKANIEHDFSKLLPPSSPPLSSHFWIIRYSLSQSSLAFQSSSLQEVESIASDLANLIRLLPIDVLSTCLYILFDDLNKKFDENPAMAIVFLASLWLNIQAQIGMDNWKLILNQTPFGKSVGCSQLLYHLNNTINKHSESLRKDSSSLADSLSASKMVHTLLASSITFLTIGTTIEDLDTKNLIHKTFLTEIEFIKSSPSQVNKENRYSQAFRFFASLGSLLVPHESDILPILNNSGLLLELMEIILKFEWPRTSNIEGIFGQTQKGVATEFESARWYILSLLSTRLNRLIDSTNPYPKIAYYGFSSEDRQRILEIFKTTCESSLSCAVVNFSNLMSIIKITLPLLLNCNCVSNMEDVIQWLQTVVQAGKQEKSFASRQIFHIMGAVMTPPVMVNPNNHKMVSTLIDAALEAAQLSIGIADWVSFLICKSIQTISRIDKSNGEEMAIHLIPMMFRLAMFGPLRVSAISPANADMAAAGYSGPTSDANTRSIVISFIYRHIDSPRFLHKFLCYMLGYENYFSSEPGFQNSQFEWSNWSNLNSGTFGNNRINEFVENFNEHKAKKGHIAHLCDYRRMQLCIFVASKCSDLSSIQAFWPYLFDDHLESIRELASLSLSIMVLNVFKSGKAEIGKTVLLEFKKAFNFIQSRPKLLCNDELEFCWLIAAASSLRHVAQILADEKTTQSEFAELHEAWLGLFSIVTPYLTYNTLYLRGTCQEMYIDVMNTLSKSSKMDKVFGKEQGWIGHLQTLSSFLTSLHSARPISKGNRREFFCTSFMENAHQLNSSDKSQTALLEMILSQHPKDSDLPHCEILDPSYIESHKILFDMTPSTSSLSNNSSILQNTVPSENICRSLQTSSHSSANSLKPWFSKEEILEKVSGYLSRIGSKRQQLSSQSDENPIEEEDQETTTHPIDPNTMILFSSASNGSVSTQFQRKIVPWQSMDIGSSTSSNKNYAQYEDHVLDLDKSKRLRQSRQELIIVASLLKKMPNFGGITRTAEIFAASKLIFPSLELLKDPIVKSLSVSAENWIPIEEVSEQALPTYLMDMKQNHGYTLVGVEQTSNSKSLVNYEFPTKSILLLGEEKHGIPPHLLPLLDDCVEIPQLGVIRSLNVHVSASIMIWEYTKQHINQ